MSSKIISIGPLPRGTDEARVRQVLNKHSLKRVKIHEQTAYVEFEHADELETLDFQFGDLKINALGGAMIDVVSENFRWPSDVNVSPVSSSNSNENSIQDLSVPHRQNLIIIKNCNQNQSLTPAEIKSQVFKGYLSVNRVLNKGKQVIVEFLDRGEIERLQADFPGLRVKDLGQNAQIDVIDQSYDVKHFAEQWGNRLQTAQKEQQSPQKLSKEEEELNQHCLHADSIPTLEKMTSMEQNFSQRSSAFPETKQRWESGTISNNNQNSRNEHVPVTTIYEDDEIKRESASKEFIFDPKLRQSLDKRKKKLDQQERKQGESQFILESPQKKSREQQQERKKKEKQQELKQKQAQQKRERQMDEQRKRIEREEKERKERQQKEAEENRKRHLRQEQSRKKQQDRKRTVQLQADLARNRREKQLAMQEAARKKEETVTYNKLKEQTVTYVENRREDLVSYPSSNLRVKERWQPFTTLIVLSLWSWFLIFMC